MKYHLATQTLLLLLSFCFQEGVMAQQLTQQDLLLQPSELLQPGFGSHGNDAYIQQVGSQNEVHLLQIQEEPAAGNLARILQAGDWNMAIISQTDGRSQVHLIQRGDLNRYELQSFGADNDLVAIQDGERNNILQQLINSNRTRSELVQVGNDNEIITILEGIQDREITIRQIGDGLKVIVRQSSF
jgi:hypothetical protein